MKDRFTRWLLVLAVVGIFSSCKSFKEPEFRRIENVRVNQIGLRESSILADLYYHNPNRSSLQLKFVEGDAWLENNYLGQFSMDTLTRILPRSEFKLPIRLKIDMSNFVSNMSVAFLKGQETTIKLEGRARVGKAGIFFNYPIRYEGKHDLGELMK